MEDADKFIDASKPDSLIAIVPENTTQRLLVSKVILCQTSDFFVKALDGEWKEAGERTLRFPGWTEDVIELFIYWAYKHDLPPFRHQVEKEIEVTGWQFEDEIICKTLMTLVRLWAFGDAHLIPALQNKTMSAILDLTERVHTPAKILRLAYENSSKDSALSRFAVDEARYEYFARKHERMSEEDLEGLAQVSGFLSDFIRPVRCRLEVAEGEKDSTEWLPAYQIGVSEYTVVTERSGHEPHFAHD